MPHLTKTAILVKAALSGKKDRGGKPLYNHCVRVSANAAKLLKEYGYNKSDSFYTNTVHAAFLHDIIEDSDINANDLHLFGYSNAVIEAVEQVSHTDKNITHKSYIDNLCETGTKMAILVKLADNLDNTDEERYKFLCETKANYLRNRCANVKEQLIKSLKERF